MKMLKVGWLSVEKLFCIFIIYTFPFQYKIYTQ